MSDTENLDAGREWMRRAWQELNAIRARDGAPDGVSHEWWNELTDALGEMLGDDTVPWMTKAAKLLVAPYEARVIAAESALSTARTTAFREAADIPSGVKSLILTADDCDKQSLSNSESACVLVGWLRELRTAVASLDDKDTKDTQT